MVRGILVTALLLAVVTQAGAQDQPQQPPQPPTIEERVNQAKEQLGLTDEQVELLTAALTSQQEAQNAATTAFHDAVAATGLLTEEQITELQGQLTRRGGRRGGPGGGEGQRPGRGEGERPGRGEGERPGRGEGEQGRPNFQEMTPEEREAFMLERQMERFVGIVEGMGVTAENAGPLKEAYSAYLAANSTARTQLNTDLETILSEEQLRDFQRMGRGGRGGQRRQPRQDDDVY